MVHLAFVILGAAIGATARYLMIGWIAASVAGEFPWGTLAVNLSGCLIAGLGLALAECGGWSAGARIFFFVGILGSFTTFSSFGIETLRMIRGDALAEALAYVAASNLGGLIVCWAGFAVGRTLAA
jgi:CrcB protein